MATFISTKRQEQMDRKQLVQGSIDLFDREYAYNYLTSVLIGRAPRNLNNVAYPQGATSILYTEYGTHDGTVTRIGRNEIGFNARRAKRTHTLKRNKGSSSAAMSKRFNSHLVEDTLQSAFLFYWQNRNEKQWLQSLQGETIEQSKLRITRLTCRHILQDTFEYDRVRAGNGDSKRKHSASSFAALRDNSDMLSAETIAENLAEMLAKGNKKTERIVLATIRKTNKKKCLARALKCSRPTLDKILSTLTLEPHVEEKSTVPFTTMTPIGQKPDNFKPAKIATVPVATVPVATVPVALQTWTQLELTQKETARDCYLIRARLETVETVDRTDEYFRGRWLQAIHHYRQLTK